MADFVAAEVRAIGITSGDQSSAATGLEGPSPAKIADRGLFRYRLPKARKGLEWLSGVSFLTPSCGAATRGRQRGTEEGDCRRFWHLPSRIDDFRRHEQAVFRLIGEVADRCHHVVRAIEMDIEDFVGTEFVCDDRVAQEAGELAHISLLDVYREVGAVEAFDRIAASAQVQRNEVEFLGTG